MRVWAAVLVATLAGCAGAQNAGRAEPYWVGEYRGQYKPFAACVERGTPQRAALRTLYDDEAKTADLIVSPPPYSAIADHEITVAQAETDKVRVVFRRRTAMDFGQTEQHVKFLAGVCEKAA